ncbi:tyrosyl-tRNA deacylase [Gilvimarinus xylanilyticus]|uniref:Tyrosyl-tRNA deacylase n=1 Tax=Gilvimarinus xylanilyticus TaxID=2944139 RepID=A0A9X2I2T0_9GAMM|nr:tyrosyl-tRNA deacylase [Gilvimarinus xylanilyticus]MCP8898462.1 tyrosyl-tRNA deacylase [Gilvimarinus xylanilyticus]
MTAEEKIVSYEFDVRKRIEERLEELVKTENFELPKHDHPLVDDYIRKIEGTYDVTRSKQDTDNAIELLYIAYNTTPPSQKDIRPQLDGLMTRLIRAQQKSERKMSDAVEFSAKIVKDLRGTFDDWRAVNQADDAEALIRFVSEDLFDLAEDIKDRADKIANELSDIAQEYDEIIDDTSKSTHASEKALADELKNKEAIEKELAERDAERQKLESLVESLTQDIAKYEKMANEYKSRAETAEERAFIMSIVQVGAQMISSAIPAITAGLTAGATGGTSLIAGAAMNTAKQLSQSESAATEDDDTAEGIELQREVADKKSEVVLAKKEKAELEEQKETLNQEKGEIEADTSLDEDAKKSKLESVEKRLKTNEQEIDKKDAKITAATTALNAAQKSLEQLGKGMADMAQKQEDQAAGLRKMQLQMLEKVEAYETEKRNQAAELVKINALLRGARTEEETIQLAIKSLGLSLKALKRAREIIIEIAFFFKSFASFMQQVMEHAQEQAKLTDKVAQRSRLSARIKRNTDDFFASQTAEWQAVEIVSGKFADNFKQGWSKLNKLTGEYLTGDELARYLGQAAEKIDAIAFARKKASTARLDELARYRDQIKAQS